MIWEFIKEIAKLVFCIAMLATVVYGTVLIMMG